MSTQTDKLGTIKPVIGPPPSKEAKDKAAKDAANNVLHHVGMVVNGFEIQKLIGKLFYLEFWSSKSNIYL